MDSRFHGNDNKTPLIPLYERGKLGGGKRRGIPPQRFGETRAEPGIKSFSALPFTKEDDALC
jgi:hypothetical protein